MNRSSVSAAVIAGLALGVAGTLVLTPGDAIAQQRTFAQDRVYRLQGDFTVQLNADFFASFAQPIEGQPGVALVTDVFKIDLLDDWAIISKSHATREVTFIVPREQITFINAESR
ncbi:MAG: hypothetical protein RLN60_04795 [Phycisphaerales bacterium]